MEYAVYVNFPDCALLKVWFPELHLAVNFAASMSQAKIGPNSPRHALIWGGALRVQTWGWHFVGTSGQATWMQIN